MSLCFTHLFSGNTGALGGLSVTMEKGEMSVALVKVNIIDQSDLSINSIDQSDESICSIANEMKVMTTLTNRISAYLARDTRGGLRGIPNSGLFHAST